MLAIVAGIGTGSIALALAGIGALGVAVWLFANAPGPGTRLGAGAGAGSERWRSTMARHPIAWSAYTGVATAAVVFAVERLGWPDALSVPWSVVAAVALGLLMCIAQYRRGG